MVRGVIVWLRLSPILMACLCSCVFSNCTIRSSARRWAPSISLWPYQPQNVVALTGFPLSIQTQVSTYLLDRLGHDLYGEARFTRGEIVNFDDLRRVDPKASYQWKVFTYRLVYTFSFPEVGISEYQAEIWLDGNGAVLRDLDFPNVGHHPDKRKLISSGEARRVGRMRGFRATATALDYRVQEGSIVWRLERRDGDGTSHYLEVSAHTGEALHEISTLGVQ
jgi:hypothetical protein